MSNREWQYYNHALIPIWAPDMDPQIDKIGKKGFWNGYKGFPIMATWTTDFDCGIETDWWYIICKKPFVLDNLSKKSQKNIRRALNKCDIKMIDFEENIDCLYNVYLEAGERYVNPDNIVNKDEFIRIYRSLDNINIWAGYEKETGRMIGYKVCGIKETYIEFLVSKYSAKFMKLRVSDALNYTVLDYYLNTLNKNYVLNGSRSINHKSNVQEYYEEHFNFCRAYCKLNICYRFPFGILIKIIYPFKSLLNKFDNITIIHQVNSVLKMERICRNMK